MSDPAIIVVQTTPAANITTSTTVQNTTISNSGPIGPQGPTGATGSQGIQGETGATGPQGIQGATGATGSQGIQGIQGVQGEQGVQGATGAAGTNGTNGTNGVDGADGVGVPAGGTAGQVLAKINSTDYNTQWVDQSGGGSSIQTYIQTTQPSDAQYVWWDTSGGNLTLWIEDGI